MIKAIVNVLWPEVCPFCQKPWQKGLCPVCSKKIEELLIKEPRCMKCGKPVRSEEQEYCHDCLHKVHYYKKGLSLWLHRSPVNDSIYQFKYYNQRVFGIYYAKEMLKQFGKQIHQWKPELIIPIPLHKKRRRKRGYNQAEIIAIELGKALDIPVDCRSVKRIRSTKPQKKVNHSQRKKNMTGAFCVSTNFQSTDNILLIDDIYTTGNTVDEVSKQLRKAGAVNIYFLTISIGQGY